MSMLGELGWDTAEAGRRGEAKIGGEERLGYEKRRM
jgi:hypothetical protein